MDLWLIKSTQPYGSRHRRLIPKCLFYGRRPGMVLIRASHPGQRTRGSRGHGEHLKMRNRKKKRSALIIWFLWESAEGLTFLETFFLKCYKTVSGRDSSPWSHSWGGRGAESKSRQPGGEECPPKAPQRSNTVEGTQQNNPKSTFGNVAIGSNGSWRVRHVSAASKKKTEMSHLFNLNLELIQQSFKTCQFFKSLHPLHVLAARIKD